MSVVGQSISFYKQKVDILRPAFAVDVSTVRDRILTDYVLIASNARCYSEITHSDRVGNAQLGGIEVARMTFFFQKRTSVRVNDVLREAATVFNGSQIRYWDVVGVMDYSAYDWHIRVDCDLKNYMRE